MSETIKGWIARFATPAASALGAGFLSSVLTLTVATERLEIRLSHVESQTQKYEAAMEKKIARHELETKSIVEKSGDHEKRLTRLEALVGETQKLLAEIREDVKQLLRGGRK